MVIAMLKSKRNKTKKAPTTKSIDTQHEPQNKLAYLFQKITRPPHHLRHAFKRPSIGNFFKSDTSDQDKAYEYRRYHENIAKKPTKDKLSRPSILIRQPSSSSSDSCSCLYQRESSIHMTTHSGDLTAKKFAHLTGVWEPKKLKMEQDKVSAYSTLFSLSTCTTASTTNSPQIWDSAFWNDSIPQTVLQRKISAPTERDVPGILHEIRRIHSVSNHSLQRHRSFVIKRGRFEVSIETEADPIDIPEMDLPWRDSAL